VPRIDDWGRLALLALGGALVWTAARIGTPSPGTAAVGCTCAEERVRNGWCAGCKRGWVASLEIRSRRLFDALDAHGHELDPAVMECATCRGLVRTGGFCESCRFGWVDGLAYMSRLTYHLARGRVRAPAEVACEECRVLAGGTGWCARCSTGWAGNVAFADPDDHRDAARELARLRRAIEVSIRCEMCALVLLVDGTCTRCRIRYSRGEVVPALEPR
jgi:hypothetical protein